MLGKPAGMLTVEVGGWESCVGLREIDCGDVLMS